MKSLKKIIIYTIICSAPLITLPKQLNYSVEFKDSEENIWLLTEVTVNEAISSYYLLFYPILIIKKLMGKLNDSEDTENISEIELYKLINDKNQYIATIYPKGRYTMDHNAKITESINGEIYFLYLLSNDRGNGKLIISKYIPPNKIISKVLIKYSARNTIYQYSIIKDNDILIVIYSNRSVPGTDEGIYFQILQEDLNTKYIDKISDDRVAFATEIKLYSNNNIITVEWISDFDNKSYKREININNCK